MPKLDWMSEDEPVEIDILDTLSPKRIKNRPDEKLIARIEDLERKIARMQAGHPSDAFPWMVLDTLLDNLMARDQFKMKSNGSCNNITIWRMLVQLKNARKT